MALIAQLGEHCTGIAEVVGSNPAQSLNFFSGPCSSSVAAALALMTVITQLLLMDKINFHFCVKFAIIIIRLVFEGDKHILSCYAQTAKPKQKAI